MTKKNRFKISDELRILQTNLEQIQWAINRAQRDLEESRKTLTYIQNKIQKLINRYDKPKKVTPVTTKEAEKK